MSMVGLEDLHADSDRARIAMSAVENNGFIVFIDY